MDWTHRLRLRKLEMLLSLAETRNISHSAAALGTTQPGLSKWLKELEGEVGLPLFERHARGLRPTAYGEALLAHARRIQVELDRARGEMEALRQGSSGQVIIGTSGASASDAVPVAVLKLLERMPQARVRLIEGTMDRLMEQLAHGDVDLVVGRSAQHDAGLYAEDLYTDPIHFVARWDHPLATRRELDWQAMRRFRWVLWPRGTPIRAAVDAALATTGQALPADHVESNSVSATLALLVGSDMIGVASRRAVQRWAQLGILRALPVEAVGSGSVAMYWRHDAFRPAAVDVVLDCLRAVAADATHGEKHKVASPRRR